MNFKNKKLLISIILILVIILLFLSQFGIFSGSKITPGRVKSQKKSISDRTLAVKETEVPVFYFAIGTIHSRDEAEISSRMTARITKIVHRSGDKVKSGETLALLENNELKANVRKAKENINSFKAKVNVAKAEIKAAEAEYKVASSDYLRTKKLVDSKSISVKRFEQAEARMRKADAGVKQAQLNLSRALAEKQAAVSSLKHAQTQLEYSKIKSPISGIISEQLAETGDIGLPGKILFKVFDPDKLMLEMFMKESLIQKISLNDKVNFYVKALEQNFTGNVKEIVPSINNETSTFLVKVCIGENKNLVPGMYGKAKIKVGKEKVLLIPEKAVHRIGQTEKVKLLTEGTAKSIFIRTVKSEKKDYRKVLSGLKPGDKIIL
ncbi:MAG: efflux RND transporter periplasmic adaptor subunit [Victivallales bacterium]|nr:efflux RND transporter periplasmic adaptor subunit [Victivallales bacterium]